MVGVGFGQAVHVPAFRADERCEVVAICASSDGRARAVAERLRIPRALGDWRALLADPDVDTVGVAVPPGLQPTIVCEAAAAGKHVFCEKPPALEARAADEMLTAVRAAGVVHGIDFEFIEVPAWRRARELCTTGVLGRIRHVALTWRIETRSQRDPVSWKRRAEEGGGALNNLGSHSLFLLEWLLGPVRGLAARLSSDGDSDTRVDCWLDMPNGAGVTLSVATDAFLGPGHRLEVYGSEGTLVLENVSRDYVRNFTLRLGHRNASALEPVACEGDGPLREGVDPRVRPVSALVRRFVDAVLNGGQMRPDLADGVRVQMLLDAVRSADRSGGWVSL